MKYIYSARKYICKVWHTPFEKTAAKYEYLLENTAVEYIYSAVSTICTSQREKYPMENTDL